VANFTLHPPLNAAEQAIARPAPAAAAGGAPAPAPAAQAPADPARAAPADARGPAAMRATRARRAGARTAPRAGITVKDLPRSTRPREKLLAQGPGALADVELLALLLRTGGAGTGVLQLSEQLLDQHDGLAGLLHATPARLDGTRGLGPAKRAELAAVLEIARRVLLQQLRTVPVFDAPQRVKDFVALRLAAREQEVFAALYLDSQHRLIEMQELFTGTLSQTCVYPREVLRHALLHNAAAVILVHNHPSGVAEPSRADEVLTESLAASLRMIDVRVLDHLVVGVGQVVSFAERGMV
jgi:DNA repair protein RadC